jgi:transcriptional regulator with XRE-family HTH domain
MLEFAARLNHLFAVVPGPSGRSPWTNDEAAAEMATRGVSMSAAYLSQLRTGKRDNPSARHVAAIADLFGVPMEYFFDADAAAKIDADLRLLTAVRDAGVQSIALRAQGLSPQSLSSIADMIEHIRRLEQVPDQSSEGDE